MKILISSLLTMMAMTFASVPAHALVEAKLTYSLLTSNPNLGALYSGSSEIPSVVPNYGIGADFLFEIPLMDWGVGVRYENLGLKADSNGLKFESKASRTALLVSYRFINTLLHVGPNFTYGLSHSSSMEVTEGTTTHQKWSPGTTTSYSAGLEVSASVLGLLVGGELGYLSMKWDGMTDSTGTTTNKVNTDMSGNYAKLFVGFSI